MKKESIIQFGEGNFLRGFIEPFVQSMHLAKIYEGHVLVIQPLATGMIDRLNQQEGKYTLFIRGLEGNVVINEQHTIDVISRGINPYQTFSDYLDLAKKPDFRFVISNTTESGIQVSNEDRFEDQPAQSFPGKLTQLLYARFKAQLPGFIHLPCELIDNNGTELKKAVLELAQRWNLGEDFIEWIHHENRFYNTLVDRIVTGYPRDEVETLRETIDFDDQLINTTEVFNLWVIEGNAEDELPLQKTGLNVVWTQDAKPYKQRKVRILNGAHTALVPLAMLKGYTEVREALLDSKLNAQLKTIIFNEIIPSLDLPKEEMTDFANTVIDRFLNPYIHHQLRSIALNAYDKFKVRVMPSILSYQAKFNKYPKELMEAFDAFYAFYQTEMVNDAQDKIDFMRTHTKEEVFKALCE